MFLKKLALINYKNFSSASFNFDKKINCFVGNNGIGKTNVLDAIYTLAFGKSYFNPIASQNIKHGEDFYVIDGDFDREEREEKVVCSLKRGQKKIIKKNAKIYERLSDHLGFIPLVIVSPADRDLITEGSDVRRKFIDSVISQSDKSYLDTLISYNKTLAQRNSLLKYFALNNTFDKETLEIYNEQLQHYGSEIFSKRCTFIEVFKPIFKDRYATIAENKEIVDLHYDSQMHNESLDQLLKTNLQKDKVLQYTSVGIHKDDIGFKIASYPIKKFGSQGQQKTFLIALKLAQFDFIKSQRKLTPILLLDDIFDKLDTKRVTQIIKMVDTHAFGQLFISDTHAERTEDVVKKTEQSYQIFKL